MHFFNPVPRMELLEVVAGSQSSHTFDLEFFGLDQS
jgi:3-hydroxyacyl-CoA dehydrogenase